MCNIFDVFAGLYHLTGSADCKRVVLSSVLKHKLEMKDAINKQSLDLRASLKPQCHTGCIS